MPEQTISAPTPDDVDAIARMLIHAQDKVRELTSRDLTWSHDDLPHLQSVLDCGAIKPNETYTLQSIGLAFGKVFVENNTGYDWWMVEDEYGQDVCVRYLETSLIIFPQTMISKRIEDGQSVNVQDMYDGLKRKLEDILKNDFPDA